MTRYEYKVIPAPVRGLKAKGVKSAEARFAHAVETAINALAGEDWDYVRSDTLPHEERSGLTGSATTFRTLLVFRRPVVMAESLASDVENIPVPAVLAAPARGD